MWKTVNTALYTLYYRWRSARLFRLGKAAAAAPGPPATGDRPVLYVAWGRIGDMVLATGHLKHLRRLFHPHPVWLLGRSETEAVVRPHIDRFIALDERAYLSDRAGQATLRQTLNQTFRYIVADIHTFYGGVFVIGPLLEQLQAERKFIYEGYYLGNGLAAWRPYPKGFTVVPGMPGTGGPEAGFTHRHVLRHTAYYVNRALEALEMAPLSIETLRPELAEPPDAEANCRAFDLRSGGFIAWQPASNNRKKDYPMDRWFEVIAAFPGQTFVALGTRQEQAKLAGYAAPNLIDLCGRTSLVQTIQLIKAARLYVGLDSGLSHIASVLGQTAICVTQNSNLGYFFPYPAEYGFTNQHTVFHPDYTACSGCFMTCRHESIAATYRRGSLCLRELPARAVVEAMKKALL